ncbi:MAG: GrpB family protein [Acidobacteriota bacterium]
MQVGPDRIDRLMETMKAVKQLRRRFESWGSETVEEHFKRLRGLRLPDLKLAVRDHDPEWAALFAAEKERLSTALGLAPEDIQHFGSTSIPPLPSKDMIDFSIAMEEPPVEAFTSLGYESYGNSPVDPEAVWFWNTGGHCIYVAHVCRPGRPWMATVVSFRDYLRAHPEERTRYAEAKQRLAAEQGQDFLGYSVGKLSLIGEVNEKAAAWIAAGRPS